MCPQRYWAFLRIFREMYHHLSLAWLVSSEYLNQNVSNQKVIPYRHSKFAGFTYICPLNYYLNLNVGKDRHTNWVFRIHDLGFCLLLLLQDSFDVWTRYNGSGSSVLFFFRREHTRNGPGLIKVEGFFWLVVWDGDDAWWFSEGCDESYQDQSWCTKIPLYTQIIRKLTWFARPTKTKKNVSCVLGRGHMTTWIEPR